MSQTETLMARDGHVFSAYVARPPAHARGAVVIAQEIFGLTPHIRRMADSYAADGYLAVAPALFDRIHRDLVLGHSPAEVEQARGYRMQIDDAKAVLDLTAAAAMAHHSGKVAVIGYCWGGLLAWLAASAAETPFAAAVSYYGARIGEHLAHTPCCPAMLHFGDHDTSIPAAEIERIRSAYPQGVYYLYPAGHGFNNEDRPGNYDAAAAALARSRTNAFLAQHIG
jgi:carboxymethylenebutenolidase